jgi:hypothetical protein
VKWWVAGLSGVVTALVVSGVVASKKKAQFEASGEALAVTFRARGGAAQAWLAQQGAQLEEKIGLMAQREAETLARGTATQYLSQVYGLTPSRITRLQTLATRWG